MASCPACGGRPDPGFFCTVCMAHSAPLPHAPVESPVAPTEARVRAIVREELCAAIDRLREIEGVDD